MAIKKDYTMDILRLLDQVKQVAVTKPRKFGPIVLGYDPDEINIQIEKVRASLPRELKDAVSLNRETERIMESAHDEASSTLEKAQREADRILADAKKETERMLEQARLKQEQMIAESEILKLAKSQSEEIRNSAEKDSRQMRQGADRYALDVLGNLESVVGRVLATVERGKAELQPPDHAVVQQQLVREKAKV